ncbi:hypothetical protein SLA2020_287790 [Shorea laevis]
MFPWPLFRSSLLLLLLLLLHFPPVHSRFLSTSEFVSDGVHYQTGSPFLLLNPFAANESSCEQTYGFMPCTTTALGNLFLIIVYGYLMYLAAIYLSDGSELLLEILGPGIIGGLFLPILRTLPDALTILVSGLSGTTEAAQSRVSVGMGLLAGSTVLLLTVIWGSCVVVGRCDLRDSVAVDGTNTKGFSLTGTGVSTEIWTCHIARIMAISVIPFIAVEVPQILNSTSARNLAILIALILSTSMLVAYCLYQVFQPWIQQKRIDYVEHKHAISGILLHLERHALGRLLSDEGEPDVDVIKKLFHAIDENRDGYLSDNELKALVIGIRFEEIDLDKDDAVKKIIKDFDTSNDYVISEAEFVAGISKWLNKAKRVVSSSTDPGLRTSKFIQHFHRQTKTEHDLLGADGKQSDKVVGDVENPRWTSFKAVLMLLLGTLIAAAFADPLVDAVDNFSDATRIPLFFISFIALPFATNASETVSVIISASRKKQKTASLAFSELYGAVTMNNLLCLSVFLALVYIRGLTWDFSSEVLVILIVCLLVSAFASFRTTFPLWTSSVAFILYPLSLVLVYVLNYVFGWS